MIAWSTLTREQHVAVFDALHTLHRDIVDTVRDHIDTNTNGRLIDAAFMITAEMRHGDDDLARRGRDLEALIKENQ